MGCGEETAWKDMKWTSGRCEDINILCSKNRISNRYYYFLTLRGSPPIAPCCHDVERRAETGPLKSFLLVRLVAGNSSFRALTQHNVAPRPWHGRSCSAFATDGSLTMIQGTAQRRV